MSDTIKNYKSILEEISDVLEGGDVAIDFENAPSAATTIRIIQAIVSNALDGVRAGEEMKNMFNDFNNYKPKEMSK
tara:strand:- start:246 stop:473 length:228 start_codon:yes stop_codon:yes gene_type:complete